MTGNRYVFWGDPDPLNGIDEYVQMVRTIPANPVQIRENAVMQTSFKNTGEQPKQQQLQPQAFSQEQQKNKIFGNATNWILILIAFLLFLIFIENL